MTIFNSFVLCLLVLSSVTGCSNDDKTSSESSVSNSDSAIKVLETTIERQNDEIRAKDMFEVRLLLPKTKNNFLKIDKKHSTLYKVVDDSGNDLLEANKKENEQNAGKWWHDPSMITDYGKHPFEPGIWTDITLKSVPAPDADKVTLSGNIILQYDTGETQTDTLADLPLKMDIETEGVETKIGKILIYGTGSVITDDTRYWSYNVKGDADILNVEVLGNDDTRIMKESTQGRGVTSTGFALHESTNVETITLKITHRIIRNEELPIDLILYLD